MHACASRACNGWQRAAPGRFEGSSTASGPVHWLVLAAVAPQEDQNPPWGNHRPGRIARKQPRRPGLVPKLVVRNAPSLSGEKRPCWICCSACPGSQAQTSGNREASTNRNRPGASDVTGGRFRSGYLPVELPRQEYGNLFSSLPGMVSSWAGMGRKIVDSEPAAGASR